jgi:signal transduction histidine kinase/CheY-like chemotaxis protein
MAARVVLSLDDAIVTEVELTKPVTVLGRHPACDIVVDHPAISGRHMLFRVVNRTVYVEDLASTNGTRINGIATSHQVVHHLDLIEVGRHKLHFFDGELLAGGVGNLESTVQTDYERTLMAAHAGEAGAGDQALMNRADVDLTRTQAIPRDPSLRLGPAQETVRTEAGVGAPVLALRVLAGGRAGEVISLNRPNTMIGAVGAATALGEGVPPPPIHSRVGEMNELHAALHAAGRQLVHAQAYRKNAERERQALLEREQKARVMAEQQNTAKDQFLAMLGHELRNPLAPISTAAQLLKLPAIDENRVRYASDVIARQVDHMNRLLGDMLDVSRVTRGLVSLTLEQIDLKAVIDRAVEQTYGLFEAKHHALSLDLPPGPVSLRGDSTRLIQVFANLLNNAAKYTPPHGRMRLAVVARPDHILVTVQDSGEGLAPELLPHIFDLFSQGERTPDRSQGGLGLGLALVKSLVQLHGGHVDAVSAGPGAGSTFSVTLPRGVAPDSAAPILTSPAVGDRPALRVMIVDDNIDGAISLSLFLQAAGGHHVCTYYDAAAALEWAAFERPDAFILDIGLPDMTGYELARRLRAMPQFAHVTLIALTGYGQPQDKEDARQAGFDQHVAKPAEPARILALLERSVNAAQERS